MHLCVVLASGACNRPNIPDWAEAVPAEIARVSPLEYRHPDQLADESARKSLR